MFVLLPVVVGLVWLLAGCQSEPGKRHHSEPVSTSTRLASSPAFPVYTVTPTAIPVPTGPATGHYRAAVPSFMFRNEQPLEARLEIQARLYGTAWQLDEGTMREVLAAAGIPRAWHEEALRVAWGESRWSPTAISFVGCCHGLFQIHTSWLDDCGLVMEDLYDPIANARCALFILEYEQSRGYQRWSNWEVRP